MNHNSDPYDQGHSQGDMGAYNTYETQPGPQNTYYQNNYAAPPAPFPPGPPAPAFSPGFVKYEDGPGPSFNGDGGYGRGGGAGGGANNGRRPVRKERDDKVHDSIIEERIQRERPCRTLFIRNIKYETNSDDVRRQFEEHGEIKTFFDLISTRGMVFVTYYDLRAAERARERLQGSEISGRPIDVHYSLPRDDHTKGNDRDKNQQQLQGTLQVTLRNSPSGQPIDDNEVRRKFQQFGDVKSVKPVGDRIDSRYVEFYDTRACDESFDRLRHQGLQDGVMDIVFAWDTTETAGPQGSQQRDGGGGNRDWDEGFRGGGRGGNRGGRGGNRGGRGRGQGQGRNYDDDYDRRGGNDYGRFPDRGDPRGRGGGRLDDDYGNRGGRGGGTGGGYNDRYDGNKGGGYGGSGPSGYNNGPPPLSGYGGPPPPQSSIPAGPPDDRLEQARKVQQLLAALKQPPIGGAPPPPVPSAPGLPRPGGMPPMPPPPPNSNPYYSQPPNPPMPPYPGPVPPVNPYSNIPPPPQSSTPQPPGPSPPASLAGLPPNILALLQSAQQQRPTQPPPGPYGMPPGPPPMMNTPPPGANPANNAQYQQLMSYLQTQKQ
ncbi:hypothetical protein BDZ94DRAFT_1243047 [Collybia nuda]|uniref:RRM domain-containing protein n=1 Tax=Collybia nuda TaxID=64659 RepID=A0A9P5YKX3_9AGAR|nr:hypothetical protein BDZ94DRAFT_1243047 [Collybia nuda]